MGEARREAGSALGRAAAGPRTLGGALADLRPDVVRLRRNPTAEYSACPIGREPRPRDFDAFFRAEYPRLVGALSLAVGRDLAADVAQEAFIRASVRWSRVGGLERPAAWTRRVALNLIADHRRRSRRRRRLDPLLTGAESCEKAERDRDLAEALTALPERQRLAVGLHHLLDLPVRVRRVGRPLGALR